MNVTRDVAVGELRLLRAWKVGTMYRRPTRALCSTYVGYTWVPGDNTASCMPQTNNGWNAQHEAPDAGCHCGFYGVFSAENIPDGIVMGIAEYWGRVRMGPRGIRAQYARVVAICPRHAFQLWFSPEMLAIIGNAYNVEVHNTSNDLWVANGKTLTKPAEFGLSPYGGSGHDSGFGIGD